jgi:hypothetical protein
MHEIAPLMPNELVDKTYHYYFDLSNETTVHRKGDGIYLGYINSEGMYLYTFIRVFNHHFAQAYAELYLKLKKEGLL